VVPADAVPVAPQRLVVALARAATTARLTVTSPDQPGHNRM
jgi:hypothetical protein